MSGWFAVNRAMFDHPIFEGDAERAGVWVWMLATAAWKDTRQDANGKIVSVKRGQLLTSYRQMSRATGASVKKLRNLIDRLESGDAIGIEKGTGRLLITIRNYEKYQSASVAGAQEGHRKGTQKEQGNKDITLEANASKGADAPLETFSILSKTLWDTAIRYLRMHGIEAEKARPIIGRWRKAASDADILSAIDAAHRSGTQDPVPYITKAIQPETTQRSASELMALRKERA